MNGKVRGRTRSWHNLRVCPGIYLQGLRNAMETSNGSRCSGWSLNPESQHYSSPVIRLKADDWWQECTQNFSLGGGGGGADPEAIYNLCLILKTMLQKSCHKCNCNITRFATAFIYTQIKLQVPRLTQFKSQGLIFLFFKFTWDFLCLFYFPKFQLTGVQPISVADFGWRVYHLKRLISSCLENLCYF
jgi:hypothetical protein